ncbi:probable rhamnogalacturonate lyase B isoform X3 [Salvia miltiorrhiza]|uniref:probable rhamnogalacturonate lyase B isoform X3 n=1 Tax=Salvia miltiorrhiza TaxID=226208 RepID=UPI0025AD82DE|nr:probable rhamnogalacturonate lyase B isoform X3 [Salvia miltiorrhiza]
MSTTKLRLHIRERYVVMENAIVRVTLSKPDGIVTAIKYNHMDNLLETANDESNRGYWDLVWSEAGSSGTTGTYDRIAATNFEVVVETEEQIELSFSRKWDTSLQGKLAPLNIDKRFILLRDSSGFYSYAIYERLEGWPGFNLDETRIAFKLKKNKFRYMAMADNRRRYMPLPDDRLPGRGQALDYPEAVLLVDPIDPQFKGEVDDKYSYSGENEEVKVHGWISMDGGVGFWQIMASNEFRTGGSTKQDLTSHMFVSAHYGGEDLVLKFGEGEAWNKVFGPVFIYLNSTNSQPQQDPLSLWEDAKQQALEQIESWPYNFPASEDFPKSAQRGNVTGTLLIKDRYVSDDDVVGNGAYIGLAPPGEVGSWQTEGKGYQFWSRADEEGDFSINNIRIGEYNLYAWMPGFIGGFKHDQNLNITPGCKIDMGKLVYEPARDGPTLWEIGIPDRTAQQFYVPDPNPKYINKLYINHPDRFRQYGLWERYGESYPDRDLVYTVGQSNYTTDWFFAHVPRRKNANSYKATTWQIKFKLEAVEPNGKYYLRLAIASAAQAELQVRTNNPDQNPALFTSGLIGKDNAIARHGIHGLYWLFNVEMPSALFIKGINTIYLTQANATSPFQGIMYDYIRLEAP